MNRNKFKDLENTINKIYQINKIQMPWTLATSRRQFRRPTRCSRNTRKPTAPRFGKIKMDKKVLEDNKN